MTHSRHRLVAIGDSLTQGFMSGAIHRADISFPSMVGRALGGDEPFRVPDFFGAGGLPINLELVTRSLSDRFGSRINAFELPFALHTALSILEETEDYWERRRGAQAVPGAITPHNLAVWGFELADAFTLTPRLCDAAIPAPTDDLLPSLPEQALYRTARRVMNPSRNPDGQDLTQIGAARRLAAEGGIENLFVFLGANNCLGTVAALSIQWSEEQDLTRLRPERTANLYRPEHFSRLFTSMASQLTTLAAERVFVATIPHVTIPPVSRGTPADSRDADGYYDYYTRPWIWDDDFDPRLHPHLTRSQAREIDATIDDYNDTIGKIADQQGWIVVDTAALLRDLAFRRSGGQVAYRFPDGLKAALGDDPDTQHLVRDGVVTLDTRYLGSTDGRLHQGGLFSLDGIHPTTLGYGLIADLLLQAMVDGGVQVEHRSPDWQAIVAADLLVRRPPVMLESLRESLTFFDRCGLLSRVIQCFM